MDLLEDEFTAITFSELKHLSDVDLPQCVSKDAALRICKNSFAVQEATGNEIFNLWVNKLIKVFEGANFTPTEWQMITDFFLEIIQQLTECMSSNLCEVIQDELASILCDTMELLKWLQPLVVELDISIVCIISGFALQTIVMCLGFSKKCKLKNGDSKIVKNALVSHNFVLQILNQSVNLSNLTDVNGLSKMTELIQKLCICGEQSSSLDVKINVQTWKCISRLTIHCAKFTNVLSQEQNATIPSLWATRPLQFLITEIGRNLTMVLREDALQQPIAQIEKYLRVTNFYLKVLQRLTANFQHEKFPCSDEFLKTFVILQTSQKLKNTEIGAVFEKYVSYELAEIFRMVFKNTNFLKALHNEQMLKKSNTFTSISDEFLNAVIIDKDTDFIDHNVDLFIQNFLYLIEDAYNFCNKDIYNKIIEQHAALAILNSDKKLKNYFKLSVNSHNLIMAQSSVDILLTISRSSFTSHTELLQEYDYWRDSNEKFSILSTNPSELLVRKLLLNYFDLCKSTKEISESELFKKKTTIQFHKSNYRFLLAIGLQRLYAHDNTLLAVTTQITHELLNLFKKWEANSNVEAYYKMIIFIKLLSTCDLAPQTNLLDNIKDFVFSLFKKPRDEIQHFCRFIEIVLDFIFIYNKLLRDEVFLQLLQMFAEHVCNLSSEIVNLFYNLLNVTLENVNFKEIAESSLSKLSNNPNTKLLDFFYMSKFSKRYQNCKINLNLCKNIKLPNLPKHKCTECTLQFETKCAKRLRIEDGSDIKCVLNGMLHESEQLLKLATKIDKFDVDVITNIVNNLQHVASQNRNKNEYSPLFK